MPPSDKRRSKSTPKQRVLKRIPGAFAWESSFMPPVWLISDSMTGPSYGRAPTEEGAWADAERRLHG
jgi:hypothetical protein